MHNHSLGVVLFWTLCGGFVFGVFVRSLVFFEPLYVFFLAASSLVALLVSSSDPKNLRNALVFACTCIAFGAGVLRTGHAALTIDPVLTAHLGERLELVGVIHAEPDVRSTQVRISVAGLSAASTTVSGAVLVILPAHTDVYYGQRVRVTGLLQAPRSFDAGVGREFNYPGYLAAQGIAFELGRATLLDARGFEGNRFVALSYRVKQAFVRGLQQALPEPQSGLAGGILVGDKRAVGKEVTEEFRVASLLHVVVLSGYNITIVISGLFYVLERTSRYVRFGAAGFIALFFAVMTGFASASLRAALMALISISGSLSGRIYKPERALALVGTAMVAWNPHILIFDPGFQLSFLATMGLTAFSPFFSSHLEWLTEKWQLREILTSTLSAQTAVLPLLLYQGGMLSLVAIPANLLALIAVPYAMFASAIASIGGLVSGSLAPIVALPAYALLSYVLWVAHFFAQIPFAAVALPAFSAWVLVPVYALLFGYVLWKQPSFEQK